MSYVEKSLVSGEEIMFKAKPHWRIFIVPVIHLFVGALSLLFSLIVGNGLSVGDILAWLLFLSAIRVTAGVTINYITTVFAVTNKRVIAKTGLIHRRSLELLLRQVESISINQRLWGRILNYGDVVVTGSGGTWESFPNIAAPMELRRRVNNQIAVVS